MLARDGLEIRILGAIPCGQAAFTWQYEGVVRKPVNEIHTQEMPKLLGGGERPTVQVVVNRQAKVLGTPEPQGKWPGVLGRIVHTVEIGDQSGARTTSTGLGWPDGGELGIPDASPKASCIFPSQADNEKVNGLMNCPPLHTRSELPACSDLEVGPRQVQDATTAPETQGPLDPVLTKYR